MNPSEAIAIAEGSQAALITGILEACPTGSIVNSWWGKEILNVVRHRRDFPTVIVKKSGNWTTCACGKMAPNLARGTYDRPEDDRLRELGMDFYRSIKHNCPTDAAKTLVKIEIRARAAMIKQSEGDKS